MTKPKGKNTASRGSGEAEKVNNPSSLQEAEGDEEYVSLTMLKQMLSVQESMLKALFHSVISSVTTRVDDLLKTVTELKKSLEFTQKNVEKLDTMATKLEDAEGEIGSLQKTLDEQSSKMEYLENQSRRNNIRVSGIPESADETWEIVEEKVKKAIREKLDMEIDIERAHRVERKKKPERAKKSGQPRTIVCRLKNWKQKEAVVRKARKEKPEGLFICEDLAVATLEKRASQVEKLKAAKKAGKTAYFILDRLIIRDKLQVSHDQG